MKYIVAYDIVENDVRTQVGNYLISQGLVRIQYSVYYGDLTKSEIRSVQMMIQDIVKEKTAVVHFFSQCSKCVDRQRVLEILEEELTGEPQNTEAPESNSTDTQEEESEISKKVDSPNEEDSVEKTDEIKPVSEDEKDRISPPPWDRELVFIEFHNIVDYLIHNTFEVERHLIRKGQTTRAKKKFSTLIHDLTSGPVIL